MKDVLQSPPLLLQMVILVVTVSVRYILQLRAEILGSSILIRQMTVNSIAMVLKLVRIPMVAGT